MLAFRGNLTINFYIVRKQGMETTSHSVVLSYITRVFDITIVKRWPNFLFSRHNKKGPDQMDASAVYSGRSRDMDYEHNLIYLISIRTLHTKGLKVYIYTVLVR